MARKTPEEVRQAAAKRDRMETQAEAFAEALGVDAESIWIDPHVGVILTPDQADAILATLSLAKG